MRVLQNCSAGETGSAVFLCENGLATGVRNWEKAPCYMGVMASGRVLKSSELSCGKETKPGFRISFPAVFFLWTKTDGGWCVGGTECVPQILLNNWISLWKTCKPLIFKEHINCNMLHNFYLKVSIYINKCLLVEKWLSFFFHFFPEDISSA